MPCLYCLNPWLQPACCLRLLSKPDNSSSSNTSSLSGSHEILCEFQVPCMVPSRDRAFQWLRPRTPGQHFPAAWRGGGRCDRHLPSALPSSSCARQRRAELVSADRGGHEKRFLAVAARTVLCDQGQPGLLSGSRSGEQSLSSPLD